MINFYPGYDYCWGRGSDVPDITAALATRIRSSLDSIQRENIDVEKLYLALLKLYKDWYPHHRTDLELRALFSVAAACTWLHGSDSEKLNDILQMLDELTEAFSEESQTRDGIQPFLFNFTTSGVQLAVERALGATIDECVLEPDLLEISFTNANYGDGLFNGVLCLDEYEGLYLLNETQKDRQEFQGTDVPTNDFELEEALMSDLWRSSLSRKYLCGPQTGNNENGGNFRRQQVLRNCDDDSEYINDSVCYTLRPQQLPSDNQISKHSQPISRHSQNTNSGHPLIKPPNPNKGS